MYLWTAWSPSASWFGFPEGATCHESGKNCRNDRLLEAQRLTNRIDRHTKTKNDKDQEDQVRFLVHQGPSESELFSCVLA